jgi:hypothetical protein
MYRSILLIIISFFIPISLYSQNSDRTLRYSPEDQDFVITNGTKRFVRALYGTNTAFRVEAGDLPEFAMYFPGMGGNMQFALMSGSNSKWLNKAQSIKAIYRPGSMLYEIKDSLLGNGILYMQLLAMSDAEGLIMNVSIENCSNPVTLMTVFGGASNKKFSRNGDIGADSEASFYLLPKNCTTNQFEIVNNQFSLTYDSVQHRNLIGSFPVSAKLALANASQLSQPLSLLGSKPGKYPVLLSMLSLKSDEKYYIAIQKPELRQSLNYAELPKLFRKAERAGKELADRVKVFTPDPYINTFGGALSIAADAIWDGTSYQHGAIAWRMPLNGWRGAYVADPLGWHDRARKHFREYAKAQYLSPDSGPSVPDPDKNMARQKESEGVSLFTSGYISRNPGKLSKPHHYDMNLVFIDQLLTHFQWTGDTAFVKEMWPLIKRHLAWEKRNFDSSNDGLYDAYCCIWASDALQYSGGGVTHSSAYNYRANKMAAYLAEIVGENAKPYGDEANKILKAIQDNLWLKHKGWYAEYKDLLGLKLVHNSAGLWSVYHTIDSDLPDNFEAYQTLRYTDTEIPHIPVKAKGLKDDGYYTLSETNWMPYTWSINNVVLAEVLHTSLAYWQGGRADDAYKLWKSSLLESMYMGSSPGNFLQISSYDRFRGELYRDFADPIGIAARTLVEGLFGIAPNALSGDLLIRPGLPSAWDHASLNIPNIDFIYKRIENKDFYTIVPRFSKPMKLTFTAKARMDGVKTLLVNGKPVIWHNVEKAITEPMITFSSAAADSFKVEIEWEGSVIAHSKYPNMVAIHDTIIVNIDTAEIVKVYDPQEVIQNPQIKPYQIKARIIGEKGNRTFFIKVNQHGLSWWQPVNIEVRNPIDILPSTRQGENAIQFSVRNNSQNAVSGCLTVNPGKNEFSSVLKLDPFERSEQFEIDARKAITGSNIVQFVSGKQLIRGNVINWNLNSSASPKCNTVDLTKFFNDKVTQIFNNQYLNPRPTSPTLQLPVQGIGNWCYPTVKPDIDDSGLRSLAGDEGFITLSQQITFKTPGDKDSKNIIFTSQWDNYPKNVDVPLTGKASHAYFLMAGTTNPMQSRIVNGVVYVEYTDGNADSLELKNPETWWPIEQDYYIDDFAFRLNAPKPLRIHLKSGLITNHFNAYDTINGFTTTAIAGGAATVLDLPLDVSKKLKKLVIKTLCNDVVIGLMAVTLIQ